VQAVKKQFDLGGDAQEELLERVEEVLRILPRQLPLGQRVRRARDESATR